MPIILGLVLQALNASINAMWVGRFLGPSALTAVTNANSVMFLCLGLVFGMSRATTLLVAQAVGAKDLSQARRVVGTSATSFGALSCAIAGVGLLYLEPILHIMGTPPGAFEFARAYLRVILIATPAMYALNLTLAILNGCGDSKTPFRFLLLSIVLDVLLNPLLIFGAGPVPAFGIAGSAAATLIANVLALLCLNVHLYRIHHALALKSADLRFLKVDWALAYTLMTKGFAMGLQLLVLVLSGLFFVGAVNRYGIDTAAAYGATWQVWAYLQMPANAIGAAVSVMVAQNIGAARWDRVPRVTRAGILLHLVITGTLVLGVLGFERIILSCFLTTPAALAIAVHMNHTGAWGFLGFGIAFILFAVVRATGAVLVPLLLVVSAFWAIRIPFAYLLTPRLGIEAIWWSFSAATIIAPLFALAYYHWGGWRNVRLKCPTPRESPSKA